MSMERLICLVRDKPWLYDSTHEQYRHIIKAANSWQRIEEELGMTGKAITNMGCNFMFICCSASYLVQVSVELTKKWKLVVLLIPTTISWFVTSSIFYLLLQGRAVKKWKNLRDNYTRLKASAKDLQRSGSAATNNKKWIHMDAMDAFMQFHIKHKPLVSSECCNSNESLLIFYHGASKQHFDMHILICLDIIS